MKKWHRDPKHPEQPVRPLEPKTEKTTINPWFKGPKLEPWAPPRRSINDPEGARADLEEYGCALFKDVITED